MRLLPIGLACAVCASTVALGAQGDALTVQGSRVNVRANPNTGAPVLLQLERGQRVIEVGRHEAWVNVEVPNFAGREGWVHRSLLAPEAVLEYVIEHEVCHLEVMDHSPRFWALLESRVPDWRRHAALLRRYGSTLVL